MGENQDIDGVEEVEGHVSSNRVDGPDPDEVEGHRVSRVDGEDDDVEGHKRAGQLVADEDDVEGHRVSRVDGEDDDVEGHKRNF